MRSSLLQQVFSLLIFIQFSHQNIQCRHSWKLSSPHSHCLVSISTSLKYLHFLSTSVLNAQDDIPSMSIYSIHIPKMCLKFLHERKRHPRIVLCSEHHLRSALSCLLLSGHLCRLISKLTYLKQASNLNFHFIFNWLQDISIVTFFQNLEVQYSTPKMKLIIHSPIHTYLSAT